MLTQLWRFPAPSAVAVARGVVLGALLVLAIVQCCLAQQSFNARSSVRVDEPLERVLDELDDTGARLTIDDVRAKPFAARFRPPGGAAPDGQARCRWYRLILDSRLARAGPLILVTRDWADSATLFEPDFGEYHAQRFGSDVPVAERRLKNGLTNVDLRRADFGRTLYIRVVGPPIPLLAIRSEADVEATARAKDLRDAFLGGVFGVLAVTAAIFALVTRVPAFSFYGIFMAMQTLNVTATMPFAARAIWPHAAPLPWVSDVVYSSISPLALFLFLQQALDTRDAPSFNRFLFIVGIVSGVAGGIVAYIDDIYGTSYYNLFVLMTIVVLVVVAGFAFTRWRRGYVSAGFYFVGITGMVAGFVLHSAFADYHPADIGFIWEALMFFAAIAYRFVVVTRERERALGETLEAKEAALRENALRIEVTEGFNKAFARFVPREFLHQLGRRDVREVMLGDHVERDISVLFCDIRSFVALSEELKPRATFAFLNRYFGRIGPIVRANNGFIDQYLGDGVKALFPESSGDAIRAAIALHGEVRRFNEVQAINGDRPIDIGVALHRGPLILATIGESERYDTTVVTEVVNVAARLEGLTKVYGAGIMVSEAILANAAGTDAFTVRPLGDLQVLGSALALKAYEICDGDAPELLAYKKSTVERFAAAMADYQAGHFERAAETFRDIAGQEPRDAVAAFFAARSRRYIELGIVRWDGIDRHESKT